MAYTGTRGRLDLGRLTEDQWNELMRSLIEDAEAPHNEEGESLLPRQMSESFGDWE
jgi:hypothetical protein